jgi:hypothetical protein
LNRNGFGLRRYPIHTCGVSRPDAALAFGVVYFLSVDSLDPIRCSFDFSRLSLFPDMALAFGVTPFISVESLDQTGYSVVFFDLLRPLGWSQLRPSTLSHWAFLLVGSRDAISGTAFASALSNF